MQHDQYMLTTGMLQQQVNSLKIGEECSTFKKISITRVNKIYTKMGVLKLFNTLKCIFGKDYVPL